MSTISCVYNMSNGVPSALFVESDSFQGSVSYTELSMSFFFCAFYWQTIALQEMFGIILWDTFCKYGFQVSGLLLERKYLLLVYLQTQFHTIDGKWYQTINFLLPITFESFEMHILTVKLQIAF